MRKSVVAAGLVAALIPALLSAQVPTGGGSGEVQLSLAEAVQRAAAKAPAVELSKLQVKRAEGKVKEARSALLPSLTGSATWLDRSFNIKSMGLNLNFPGMPPVPNLVGPFNTYDARLQVHQTILDVPSMLRVRAAGSAVDASDAEQQVSSEASAQRAAEAYLQAARTHALMGARKADVALASELLDLAQTELKAGVGTAIDVTRAQTQLVTAQGQEQVAQNQAEQAQIGLARALGVDPSTRFALTDSLSTLDDLALPATHDPAVAAALKDRPELKAVSASLAAAEQTRQSTEAERLPRLDLMADYGVNGPTVSSAIPTGEVGVSVSLPLLDGFRREAQVKEDNAAIRQARIKEKDTRQQVQADVEGALLNLRSGEQQLDVAHQQLKLAQQELDQARDRFKSGVAGNIEVIEAQSSLVRARDADINARFATAVARINLAHAVGATQSIH